MKVSVGADKKWLRLRWKENGRYKILYPGCENNSEGARTAKRIALQMEEDFEKGVFDYSLSKYRIKSVKSLESKSFEDIYKEWLRVTKKHLSERTIQAYKSHANSLSSLNILTLTPELITSNEVYSIVDFLKNSNSPKTIKLKLKTFSSAWEWGKKNGSISTANPFKEVEILNSNPPTIDPFSREEVRKILEFAPLDKKPFIKFLFLTGCRLGEAIGLQWEDLSPNCQNVKIRQQFTAGKFKPLKKGGKPRSFCLPVNFADELLELKSQSEQAFVFGTPINLDLFRRIWIGILLEAKVKYRKPYNTRHTFVCHRLQEGWKPSQIVQVTGHSLQVMFSSYATFMAEELHLPDLE